MALSIGIGFAAAFVLARLVIRVAAAASPGRAKRSFDQLQMASAAFMAFNHGLNDGQKFMGVFALTLLAGGVTSEFSIPWWVIVDLRLHHGPRHQRGRLADHRDGRARR